VVCLVNRERAGRHLPALRELRLLDGVAQRHTDEMVAQAYLSHEARGGSSPASRANRAGYRWSKVGENIASGYATPGQVVGAWMSSAGHCRNILDPGYRDLGVGVNARPVRGVASGPATWTQDFGRPAGAAPPSHNAGPANGCPY
jgi:uncharacterized protein YkwD